MVLVDFLLKKESLGDLLEYGDKMDEPERLEDIGIDSKLNAVNEHLALAIGGGDDNGGLRVRCTSSKNG